MQATLSLAIRNLSRNRRRSLATLLSIALGASAILLFGGYSKNIKYSLQTAYIRDGGHLQIQDRDYFLFGSGSPEKYGISNYSDILSVLRSDPILANLISRATPALQFNGLAGNYEAGVSKTVLGIGYVAEDIDHLRKWNEYALRLKSPRFGLVGKPTDAAIIGVGVARILRLCGALAVKNCPAPSVDEKAIGENLPADIAALAGIEHGQNSSVTPAANSPSRLDLLSSHGRGTPNVAALQIIAAEGQGFKELDDVVVILHLEQAQRLVYGKSNPRATSLIIQLRQTHDINPAMERITALLASMPTKRPLSVLSFETLNPFYVQTLQLFDAIFGFIFVLIGGIVLFTVSSAMAAAVVERTVEIGTIRAIGLREAGIRHLFLTEGALLGTAGAVLGAATAIVTAGVVNHLNLTWVPPGSTEPLPLSLIIWGETGMLVGTTLGLMGVAAASAWWPAFRAARLKVVESLRHV